MCHSTLVSHLLRIFCSALASRPQVHMLQALLPCQEPTHQDKARLAGATMPHTDAAMAVADAGAIGTTLTGQNSVHIRAPAWVCNHKLCTPRPHGSMLERDLVPVHRSQLPTACSV